MQLFAQIHDPSGERVVGYEGMDAATVTALLTQAGIPFDLIDAATFRNFLAAHQPVPQTAAQLLAFERTQAVNELTVGTQALTKLQRAILLVILDEINVIRGLLVPSQVARTPAQFKSAIQAKINSGAAD